jgi:zinc protease
MTSTVTHQSQNRSIHRAVLSNGLVVLVAENPTADIVAGRIFMRMGTLYEPPELAGISYLLTSVLTKGTGTLNAQAIAEQVESVGASLGADSSADYSQLSLKTVSADFAEMLALAGELMRSPSFPEAEVDLERRLAMQSIRSTLEQPFSVAQQQLLHAMYQEHPYAQIGLGTETTLSNLSQKDLFQYHQTHIRPDNLVISIVGRLKPDEAIALVERTFGDWKAPIGSDGQTVPLPALSLSPLAVNPHPVIATQDTQQAIIMLGHLGTSVNAKDYAALKLISTYLGNGLSSRLFVELREKQGLAYEVSSFFPTRLEPAQFVTYIGTAPENTAVAYEGLHRETERLRQITLSDEELQTAKNKLLGQYALGKQTNAQIAQVFGWYETLGLGIAFDQQFQTQIADVTTEMAQDVAQRYFAKPYVSLVGSELAANQLSEAMLEPTVSV